MITIAVLAGCASQTRAPVEDRASTPPKPPAPATSPRRRARRAPVARDREADWRPQTYTVKRGDTLYQIALDHGLDYRELAAWNSIENVNVIRVGQVLRLRAPGEPGVASATGVTTAPLRTVPAVVEAKPAPAAAPRADRGRSHATADNYKSLAEGTQGTLLGAGGARRDARGAGAARSRSPSRRARRRAAAPKPEPKPDVPRMAGSDGDDDDRLDWVWPAKGKVVGAFSETANLKGIDIAGAAGQPVLASAGGTVVYAGTGLRGYGKLIIIKHNKTYLSAYAHNRDILVKEGQAVTKGQKIAEMGNTDATEVKLHFEIRRLGKPMDPARYLPPA